MLSKSLIQFSVDGWNCVPSLLLTWVQTMVEVVKIMRINLLQKIPYTYCYTHCPKSCSKAPPTHTSTRDSWTLMGKSGSASCGVTAPFSWVLVHTSFCICPPRVYGLMATSSKRAYAILKSAAPRAPVPVTVHC